MEIPRFFKDLFLKGPESSEKVPRPTVLRRKHEVCDRDQQIENIKRHRGLFKKEEEPTKKPIESERDFFVFKDFYLSEDTSPISTRDLNRALSLIGIKREDLAAKGVFTETASDKTGRRVLTRLTIVTYSGETY